jgi:DNA-binding response OmpR family regulator
VIQILLVADDPAFRERLRLALERLEVTGEEVTFLEADDGNDALVLAAANRPDLVVVDVGATPYGGFGLTRDLKADPDLACPVIVVLDRFQDEWLGRWSGADALVHQPVDPFALAQVARRLLEEDQGREEQGHAAEGRATLEGAAP